MFGVRGFLAAPLSAKNGEVIGVIRALCKEPRNFTAQEIDLFEQFANGAAIAVENERLYIDLERSNKIKSEFLSIMSHELRTPLNVILGYASLAQDDSASAANQQHRHTAQKIEVQARELLDMINSIMDASQIESGAIGITKQKIHVGALFEDLQAAYDPKRQKDIALVWQVPDNLPDLVTDYDKLHRIMRNLIDNAIKFTECGTVTVSAFGEVADLPGGTRASFSEGDTPRALQNNIGSANDAMRGTGHVEFAVQDTGIGIADENLPHIFDVFKQVDSSTTRDYGGIGVGLYIAKSFIELLGGQLRVCSEVGKGSTFTVRIPCDS
jgi:signal transduction histidine kinase